VVKGKCDSGKNKQSKVKMKNELENLAIYFQATSQLPFLGYKLEPYVHIDRCSLLNWNCGLMYNMEVPRNASLTIQCICELNENEETSA